MTPRGKKWKQEDIINAFKQTHGNTYDYSRVVYVGTDVNVWIGCKKHPNSRRADKKGIVWFQQTPHHHLAGEGCPLCNESHTERLIANWLNEANINYEQYKDIEWLPKGCHVDFYLPDYGVAIEYQGELHYLPKFGNNELEKQQQRDSTKRELCKQHNLPLYEITYTDNVSEKLQEIINVVKNNTHEIKESKTNKNMKKNVVKINENTLRQIVAESVKKVLKEGSPLWGNEVHPTPYQNIVDALIPIGRELRDLSSQCGDEEGYLKQEEANIIDAYNHIVKAMDLLRYPEMRRD